METMCTLHTCDMWSYQQVLWIVIVITCRVTFFYSTLLSFDRRLHLGSWRIKPSSCWTWKAITLVALELSSCLKRSMLTRLSQNSELSIRYVCRILHILNQFLGCSYVFSDIAHLANWCGLWLTPCGLWLALCISPCGLLIFLIMTTLTVVSGFLILLCCVKIAFFYDFLM